MGAWHETIARVRALLWRVRRALARTIAPEPGPLLSTGGPPSHWVEKVRAGAPHLLEPAPALRTAAPRQYRWPSADPPRTAVMPWTTERAPAAAPIGQPAAAPAARRPPRPSPPSAEDHREHDGPARRLVAATRRWGAARRRAAAPVPPRTDVVAPSAPAVPQPENDSPSRPEPPTGVRWPDPRTRATVEELRPDPAPPARLDVGPLAWPSLPAPHQDVTSAAASHDGDHSTHLRPLPWPASPARPVVSYDYPPAVSRWPELPETPAEEVTEPTIDGASPAERLRREHESGW